MGHVAQQATPSRVDREAGHEAEVFLAGEAVYLMKDAVANAMVPVGWPPLRELLKTAHERGVKVHV